MRALQPVLCWFGLHKRRRSRTYRSEGSARSSCRGCRRSMIKDARGWRLDLRDA